MRYYNHELVFFWRFSRPRGGAHYAPVRIMHQCALYNPKYGTYRLIHGLFHIALVISTRPWYRPRGTISVEGWWQGQYEKRPCINLFITYFARADNMLLPFTKGQIIQLLSFVEVNVQGYWLLWKQMFTEPEGRGEYLSFSKVNNTHIYWNRRQWLFYSIIRL